MEELNFKLEIFEGPLDLMLSLISKHKLNIRDIEISILLDQFLDYLDKLQEADIEVAGEFVEMAPHLIYIKTQARDRSAKDGALGTSHRVRDVQGCRGTPETAFRRGLGIRARTARPAR